MRTHLFAITAVLALKAGTASGQLAWGVNGAGGTGTWNVTTPNWWNGSANVVWATNGQAVFGGIPGTVTIAGASLSRTPSASRLIFNVPGYVLQGTSLFGSSAGLTVETNASATINSSISPFAGVGTFSKTGTATLTISNSLAFNQVAINEGELKFVGSSTASSSSIYSLTDAPNVFLTLARSGLSVFSIGGLSGGGASGGVVRPDSIPGTQTLRTGFSGGSFAGSLQDNGSGILALSTLGLGFQRLTGTNTYSGVTSVADGTLAFSHGGSAVNSPVTIFSGTLLLDNTDVLLADRLSNTAPIRVGGTLAFRGNGAAPVTEKLGPLHFRVTRGAVTITPQPGQPATLIFDSLAPRSATESGVISFQAPNLGALSGPGTGTVLFTQAPALAGGSGGAGTSSLGIVPAVLGFSASGSTFVTYGSHGIRPLSDAEYIGDLSEAGGFENVSLGTASALAGTTTINSLRLDAGGAVTGGHTLAVGSGMILARVGSGSIAAGVLDFGMKEGIVTTEGDLSISSTILGSNPSIGLIKNGPGRLLLTSGSSFTGAINVSSGTLQIQNASALGNDSSEVTVQIGSALEVQGGIAVGAKPLTVIGGGQSSQGGLRSLDGDNSWSGAATLIGPTIRVEAGSFAFNGAVSINSFLSKVGAGTLLFRNAITGSSTSTLLHSGVLASNAPGGKPFGSSKIQLNGGSMVFAPSGTGADVLLQIGTDDPSLPHLSYLAGSATLGLAKGNNRSLTLTIGPSASNPFSRGSSGTLIVAPSGGVAALGVTELVKIGIVTPGVIPLANGIFSPSLIVQDNDISRSGDFVTFNTISGFLKATYSTSTSLQTAGASAIFNATTPQTLIADATVFALKNNWQSINLNGQTLAIGGSSPTNPGGLIMNGGSIAGGTLTRASNTEIIVYTSLAGGAISSRIGNVATPVNLTAFGPGMLHLTGDVTGNLRVNGGVLKFDSLLAGGINVSSAATLSGTGKATARVAGGMISPGNSAGILTAGSTSQNNSDGLDTFFAFEFTSLGRPDFASPSDSGNDVLRLTDLTAPFGSVLTTENEISVYFNLVTGVNVGDTFFGGFFTDKNAPFDGSILEATWRVFLADPLGDADFNGTKYRPSTDGLVVSTVPQTANFGAGNVNGYITRVTVVPEPGVAASLLAGVGALLGGTRRGRRSDAARI